MVDGFDAKRGNNAGIKRTQNKKEEVWKRFVGIRSSS